MELPKYRYNNLDYYVDYRLSQFRSIPADCGIIKFYDFESDFGDRILASMIRKGVADLSLLAL